MPHSDTMAAQAVLGDMKKRGLTRIALISDTGGFGKSGRVEVGKVAKELGMTLSVDETFGERDTDMTPLLTKVKQSDAQTVFMFSTGQAPAIIARNYKQLDLKLPLYTTHSQASYEFIRLAGPAGEGIRMPTRPCCLRTACPRAIRRRRSRSATRTPTRASTRSMCRPSAAMPMTV
jgi:branched-chain amino acid transport system substrate-binding protein